MQKKTKIHSFRAIRTDSRDTQINIIPMSRSRILYISTGKWQP